MKLGFMKKWRRRCYRSAYFKKRRKCRFCCITSSLREVCEILNSNINFRNK